MIIITKNWRETDHQQNHPSSPHHFLIPAIFRINLGPVHENSPGPPASMASMAPMASILQRPSEGCQAQMSMAYLETQLTKDLRRGKAAQGTWRSWKCVEKWWTFTSKSWKVLCIYIYIYTYTYIYMSICIYIYLYIYI